MLHIVEYKLSEMQSVEESVRDKKQFEPHGVVSRLKLNSEVDKQPPETTRGKHHKIFELQEPDQLMSSRVNAKDEAVKAPEGSLEDVQD